MNTKVFQECDSNEDTIQEQRVCQFFDFRLLSAVELKKDFLNNKGKKVLTVVLRFEKLPKQRNPKEKSKYNKIRGNYYQKIVSIRGEKKKTKEIILGKIITITTESIS